MIFLDHAGDHFSSIFMKLVNAENSYAAYRLNIFTAQHPLSTFLLGVKRHHVIVLEQVMIVNGTYLSWVVLSLSKLPNMLTAHHRKGKTI